MRLRRSRDFQCLKRDGKKSVGRYLILNWSRREEGGSRLGIIASRKFGGSVQRNRLKRWLREIFRQTLGGWALNIDLVVIPRYTAKNQDFHSIEQDFLRVLKREGIGHSLGLSKGVDLHGMEPNKGEKPL